MFAGCFEIPSFLLLGTFVCFLFSCERSGFLRVTIKQLVLSIRLLLHMCSNWNLNECGSFHGNRNLTSVFRVSDVSVAVLMSADTKMLGRLLQGVNNFQ